MSLVSRALVRKCTAGVLRRNLHATSALQSNSIKKFMYVASGYHKYGLMKDDLLCEYHPDVEEAVRRLPEDLLMGRIHRAIRAQQAEISHSVLPEDQWTKFEDKCHNYLTPYLEEVIKEREEREEWDASL